MMLENQIGSMCRFQNFKNRQQKIKQVKPFNPTCQRSNLNLPKPKRKHISSIQNLKKIYEIRSHYLCVGRNSPLLMISDSQKIEPHTYPTSTDIHRDRSQFFSSHMRFFFSRRTLALKTFINSFDLNCEINSLICSLLLLLHDP